MFTKSLLRQTRFGILAVGSLLATSPAMPEDCYGLVNTDCCQTMGNQLCLLLQGCGTCCGDVYSSNSYTFRAQMIGGWDSEEKFPPETDAISCIYFPPKCTNGECDVETYRVQLYCVGDLAPDSPGLCLG